MSESKSIKTICSEIEEGNQSFYIPDYQRGYRWDKEQAEDLLNDIKQFFEKHKEDYKKDFDAAGERYYVQPLVVRLDEGKDQYRVIDGQQRLTTFSLIILALDQLKEADPSNYAGIDVPKRHSIEYHRSGSKEYLDSEIISNPGKKYDNLDYLHMSNVYTAVKDWFVQLKTEYDDTSFRLFCRCLFEHVCFIWHKIEGGEKDEIETFERLNVYKISLTESELIKALFLNQSTPGVDKNKIWRIASEWDVIENRLQDDAFWGFIHSSAYKKPTRIDLIFDLIYRNDSLKLEECIKSEFNKIKESEHQSFKYFDTVFDLIRKQNKEFSIDNTWSAVKNMFMIFEEWYSDYKLFHYIGYLMVTSSSNKKMKTNEELLFQLIQIWLKSSSKDEFIEVLEAHIADVIRTKTWSIKDDNKNPDKDNWKKQEFEDTNYSKRECNDLLLLHNVETIVRQNDSLVSSQKYNLPNFTKIPFHLYNIEKWETEHIRPNSGDKMPNKETEQYCLSKCKPYLGKDSTLKTDIDNYINSPTRSQFESLYKEVLTELGSVDESTKNLISNYTLLDKSTNIEFSNYIYPIKQLYIRNKENGYKIKYDVRQRKIVEIDRIDEVAYILPCTKNVFANFYSTNKENKPFWSNEDAKEYLSDMENKIGRFINIAFDREQKDETNLVAK